MEPIQQILPSTFAQMVDKLRNKSDEELKKRKENWIAPQPVTNRGYVKFYIDHVQQANLGADLDILQGGSGSEVTRDLH